MRRVPVAHAGAASARARIVTAVFAGLAAWTAVATALPRVNAPHWVGDPNGPFTLRVEVTPGKVHLGETATYRAWVRGGGPGKVRFVAAPADSSLTWGTPKARSRNPWQAAREPDLEVPVQAFQLGMHVIPGWTVEVNDGSGPRRMQLPGVRLAVAGEIAPGDTSARLRPLHGPLAAPWWERIPWLRVAAGVGALIAVVLLVRALRRRRPAPLAAPAPVAAVDPAARALAELNALRRERLPEQGRFGEHAFHLTRIARGYVEAVAIGPRPGDTTPELVARLARAPLPGAATGDLSALLRGWDLIKFARAATDAGEARGGETALERLIRAHHEARAAAAAPKVA